MNTYDAIIRALESEGVDTIFALMSEDTMGLLTTIDEQEDCNIDLVQTRHEQGAMAMADGYSRAGNGIGVCIVGRGPAIAQTGTSLVTARKGKSDLLVLVPEPKLSASHSAKQFEQNMFLRSTIGNVASIRSPKTLLPELTGAFRSIRVGEGPIAVQIAWDVLDGETDVPGDLEKLRSDVPTSSATTVSLVPGDDQIDDASSLLANADKQPVILAGRGAVRAEAKGALESVAERTGALLATTLQERGYFDDHPFSIGFVGGYGSELANSYLRQSDTVLAVGCSLNPYTTNSEELVNAEKTVIHIDADRTNIGRYTPVDVSIVGDAQLVAKKIGTELDRQDIDRSGEFWTDSVREHLEAAVPFDDGEFQEQSGRIDPRVLLRSLEKSLPKDRLVVTDAGHFACWVFDGVTTNHPDDYIWSADFAAIGQGLAMGIGAARAADDRSCVTFCGDAGFMMAQQEVDTAVRNEIPMTIIVMNDSGLGAEYHKLRHADQYADTALIDTPDIADIATAMNAESHIVRSSEDLDEIEDVLGQLPTGPRLIECKINQNVRHRSREKM